MRVEIHEVEYSVSPGGVDCWEMDVREKLGHTKTYSDYNTAGDALNHLLYLYPGVELDIGITSLEAYNKIMERQEA